MPNWCVNTLTLRHQDSAMISRAARAFESGTLLHEFIPVPDKLIETVAGSYGHEYDRELQECRQQLNLKYFGYKDWYDFCVAKWGTKWDVGGKDGHISSHADNLLECSFSSAWAPPVAAYVALQQMGFEITAFYWEPGMAFAGMFDDEGDHRYQIEGAEDAANLPHGIDDVMNISASLEMWGEA